MTRDSRIVPGRWALWAPSIAVLALSLPPAAPDAAAQAAGQELAEFLPEEAAGFTLTSTSPQGPDAVQAVYQPADGGEELNVILAYGEGAANFHQQLASAPAAESRELTVGDMTFTGLEVGTDHIVFKYFDDILLGAGYELSGPDADGAEMDPVVVAFMEDFGPDQLTGWTPSGAAAGLEEEAAGAGAGELCQNPACFQQLVDSCEAAQFQASLAPSVTARYAVEGPADAGGCTLSFQFEANPNPELVEQPMYFTLGPDEGFTEEVIQRVMEGCLDGDEAVVEAHDCQGPLLDLAP